MTSPEDDHAGLDRFIDGFDYPMFVVTTVHDGRRAGCLVGFASQVSIEPFHLLVCLSVKNHTHRVASHASILAVHLIPSERRDLAALFGSTTGDEIDKFAQCAWQPGPAGVPLLADAARCLTGRIIDRIDLGDHVGYLLEPIATTRRSSGPVVTFSDVDDLPPGHQA